MSTLLLRKQHGVATITLNRADKHNAFDEHLIAELLATLATLRSDNSIRIVVLASQGKSFSAGADLQWMQKMVNYDFAENCQDAEQLAQLLYQLYHFPKPTIARIQGSVFGGGVGLVACCDIAICVDHAQFCFSETKLGLIPATISPYVIACIGARQARRWFLSAETFTANTAQQLGLVHEVVSAEMLEAACDKLTLALLQNGPQALIQCKQLVHEVATIPITPSLIGFTATQIATCRTSTEGQEGLTAFLTKRKPNWILPSTS
jgi:methylglutaconyl-CoA hydratase